MPGKPLLSLLLLLLTVTTQAQNHQKGYRQDIIDPVLLESSWSASWISAPGVTDDYDVCHFRKTFALETVPESYVVHVSADNRYKFFVNGEIVSLGPARSDVYNWCYETVDIAPYLQRGENLLAAVVWNYGQFRPAAQVSFGRTAFILQGNTRNERAVNTGPGWLCLVDHAYSPNTKDEPIGYYVAGPGERIDGKQYPWGWEKPGFDDSGWEKAIPMGRGAAKGTRDYTGRLLVPAPIPAMDMHSFKTGSFSEITIPANSTQRILLDNGRLMTGYLTMRYSQGNGAEISIGYAESLYEPGSESKGNRNETEGKDFWGYRDIIIADGGNDREFTSLWWRTWRYLEIVVKTGDEALCIDELYGTTSYYPFEFVSTFNAAGRDDLNQILDVGFHTARLCANETYMDCPYYEQMQYFGDTRIQTMLTLYNTRDEYMVKRAIELGRQSISPDGITMSRYPTASSQFIPPYSLSWIGIIYDYWMMRGDDSYVKTLLPATRSIISWYEQWLMEDGSVGKIPYWGFADWADEFKNGEARQDSKGHSAFRDFEFLYALQEIMEIERSLGLPQMADHYKDMADCISSSAREKYWVSERGLFADDTDHDKFSQHVNSLAILTGVASREEAANLFHTIEKASDIAQCTVYYRYYMNQALAAAGLGDELLDGLDIWTRQLELGLTTWAESPEPSRSDCHAWGASPNIEFFRTVLGIKSVAPGFKKIEIAPCLGTLKKVKGSIPHPDGDISVEYSVSGSTLKAVISVPDGTEAELQWNGKSYRLKPGLQTITAK